MVKSFLILAIALVFTNGDPISRNQRFGEFSRYYLYNNVSNGVQLPLAGPAEGVTGPPSPLIDGVVTVVLIHGHGGTYQTSLNPDIRREILETFEDKANVISVDWSLFASSTYAQAQASIESVGEYLATFLENNNIDPSNLHLVGFNLGAHIAGIAARRLRGVARITGLDPSASNIRLARTDASYVEVIHTDASGTVLSNGIPDQLGHADFYPNGGRVQPGCANNACHHDRAWLFFAASIRDNTFNANCCETIAQKDSNTCRLATLAMGNNRLIKYPCAYGIYRVNTGMTYPF